MRAIRVVLAMALTTIGLVAATAVPATACSCVSFTTEQALARADVVATGVLVDVEQPPAEEVRSSTDPVTYTAAVDATYKGDRTEELVFTSALYGASCGLEGMVEGERYVFFLQRVGARSRWLPGEPGDLVGSLCGGTRRAGAAVDARLVDIAGPPTTLAEPSADESDAPADGERRVEESAGSPQDEPRSFGWLPWTVASLGLVVLGSWWARRRVRRLGS